MSRTGARAYRSASPKLSKAGKAFIKHGAPIAGDLVQAGMPIAASAVTSAIGGDDYQQMYPPQQMYMPQQQMYIPQQPQQIYYQQQPQYQQMPVRQQVQQYQPVQQVQQVQPAPPVPQQIVAQVPTAALSKTQVAQMPANAPEGTVPVSGNDQFARAAITAAGQKIYKQIPAPVAPLTQAERNIALTNINLPNTKSYSLKFIQNNKGVLNISC
ncbi:MAG: hypothetical protein F3739_07930, partial [Nitrospinae bacterium]|nr:hypothetical protein [Nitrospinota bacterium]